MKSLLFTAIVTLVSPIFGESLQQHFATNTDERLLEFVKSNPQFVQNKDESECIALHHAARYSRLRTAKWLIDNGSDVNAPAYNDFTPMHLVTDRDIVLLLLDLESRAGWVSLT